jgi:hypothetical protein
MASNEGHSHMNHGAGFPGGGSWSGGIVPMPTLDRIVKERSTASRCALASVVERRLFAVSPSLS